MSNQNISQGTLQELIVLLEQVRRRPGMYLGNSDPERFIVFKTAFHAVCRILGADLPGPTSDVYEEVMSEYGWDAESLGAAPLTRLRERGTDDQTILNTMIDMEIEVLRRHYGLKQTTE